MAKNSVRIRLKAYEHRTLDSAAEKIVIAANEHGAKKVIGPVPLPTEKQVITITHSPQVAAAGDQRYSVVKQVKDGATYTQVGPLTQEAAITAIAQMMAGSDVTDAAKRNAADLMESFKK